MKSPFISRVIIKNYRNFKDIDVKLSHKQMIIGENNVGKTNFLRALQLILDPYLSERDRLLSELDFNDSIENPLENGEIIEIIIEIQGYEHNSVLLSQLCDASISDNPPTLKLTYRFFPEFEGNGITPKYQYNIFKGDKEHEPFSYKDRLILNLRVIKALRDVETDMKSFSRSPLLKLINKYDFEKEDLELIAEKLKEGSDLVLKLDEIVDLKKTIDKKFATLVVNQSDSGINLNTVDINPNRVLNTLQLMLGERQRPTSEISLGLCNILYVSLLLLTISDNTIPSFLKKENYESLLQEEGKEILDECYLATEKGNYKLKDNLNPQENTILYEFMSTNFYKDNSFTILAIEEPEAHLHPILQRLIYRDVMQKGETSVLLTSHSTHIASVAPIDSIVHLKKQSITSSEITSTSTLSLNEFERKDLERYIDTNRGEIYFGRGVILVEGTAEEYIIPAFANLLEVALDNYGITICNIDSTNFKPYVKLLRELNIPYSVITDGDFYLINENGKRDYNVLPDNNNNSFGYLGNEIASKILGDLGIIDVDNFPIDF